MSLKILFLLSAPHQDLSLDEEYRKIEQAIEKNSNKGEVELVVKLSTRIEDLIEALNHEKPHVVHFSGHGNEQGKLLFTGDNLENMPIAPETLLKLFKVSKENVKLVFLDACHSHLHAKVLNQEVDYLIGMNDLINEETATTFASNFYASLASNKTIQASFDQAKVVLEIKHAHEKEIPLLFQKKGANQDFKLSDLLKKEVKKDKKVNNIVKGNLYGVQHIEKGASASFRFENNEKQKKITHKGTGDIVLGNKSIHTKNKD